MSVKQKVKLKIEVGTKLWWVNTERLRRPLNSDDGHEVTVTKVGRKWVDLDNYERFDMTTWRVDFGGFSERARIYYNQEDFREKLVLAETWKKFTARINNEWKAPPNVTVQDIQQAIALIFKESING